MKGFRDFILRGNVVDLAVGVVIGVAFGALVTSLVDNLLTPLIAIPGDHPDFSAYSFTVSGAEFRYGAFVNSLISFLLIAATVYVFVVVPVNKLMARRRTEPEVASTTRDCPYCISAIPVHATRCAFCTAEVDAVAP